MTTLPSENEGLGVSSGTGARRASRAFNSEFIEFELFHEVFGEPTQSRPSKAILAWALNMDAASDHDFTIHYQLGDEFERNAAIFNVSKNCLVVNFFDINFHTEYLRE
jgi:hypothetical protein